MIEFEHVTKRYDENIGIEDVSIKIDAGEFVFIVGPSGAGKSTFIKLMLKEIDADGGSIIVNGREVTELSNREIPAHRRSIGIVFQDFRLLPNKTVFENVAFAMEIVHTRKRRILKAVPRALDLVGIGEYAERFPDDLSAGEQQRVAIARAIVNEPTVLIADEPTGNLDPDTAWEIMKLLERINQTGTTVLMVTHAKDIVDRMNKRVIAIDNGRIIQDEYGKYDYRSSQIKHAGGSKDEEADDSEDRLGMIGVKGEGESRAPRGTRAARKEEKRRSKQAERDAKERAKREKAARKAAAARAKETARMEAEERRKEEKRRKRHEKGDMNLRRDEIEDALAQAAAEAEQRTRREAEIIYGSDYDDKSGDGDNR
ncbi:MAG: cell division ATP-binding protein FtsE [Anaerovoracaceae bacterium]|nr:cell division ATP-binding protein FtsE [Anaerovoracaceae bacterium]